MRFYITVTPDDGEPVEVVTSSKTVAQWERSFTGRSAAQLASDTRLVDLYALAWIALGRPGKLTEFEDNHEIALHGAPEAADPTQPAV